MEDFCTLRELYEWHSTSNIIKTHHFIFLPFCFPQMDYIWMEQLRAKKHPFLPGKFLGRRRPNRRLRTEYRLKTGVPIRVDFSEEVHGWDR